MRPTQLQFYFRNTLLVFFFSVCCYTNSSFGQFNCDSLIVENGFLNFIPKFSSDSIEVGDEFCVTIETENYIDVIAFQFTLGFNPSVLKSLSQFSSGGILSGPVNFNSSRAKNGIIGVLQFDLNAEGKTLSDGSEIMTLCFELLKIPDQCVKLELINTVRESPPSEVNYYYENFYDCSSNIILLNAGNEVCIPAICTDEIVVNTSVCNSLDDNGSVTLSACGGLAPYNFEISKDNVLIYSQVQNNDFDSFNLSDLENGLYDISVTDATGEQAEINFDIEPFSTISISDILITHPRCANTVDGSIALNGIQVGNGDDVDIFVSNGFNYLDVIGDLEMPNLRNGEYRITLEDYKGCQFVDTLIVNSPPIELEVEAIPCCENGFSSGYLNVAINGGTPFSDGNYSINGAFAKSLESTDPCNDVAYDEVSEEYIIRVQDANGCILTERIAFPKIDNAIPEFIERPIGILIRCDDQKVAVFDAWYLNFGGGIVNLENSSLSDYTFHSEPSYDEILTAIEICNAEEDLRFEVWIEDQCGNRSERYTIMFDLLESSESFGCVESCDTEFDGCHSNNVIELLNGFLSSTGAYDGIPRNWPLSLCSGGIPENISWFSFVAGSPEIEVTISTSNCTSPGIYIGLESGIFDGCEIEDGQCIVGSSNCDLYTPMLSYSAFDLKVGKKYYLYIDGCDGSECEYEVLIENAEGFTLDTPKEIMISGCQFNNLTDDSYCPNSVLQFEINHAGDSPTNFGIYSEAGPYDPSFCANYHWTFSPPINGLTEGSWNPCTDGVQIPGLSFENVTNETVFEICLIEITAEYANVSCDDCCKEFTIKPQEDEVFGSYDVCISELISGWDVSQIEADPNGDGFGWSVPFIDLDIVQEAILNNNGRIINNVVDSLCGCDYNQILEVKPVGSLEREVLNYKMFDCQFRNVNGELTDYTLNVNGEEQIIDVEFDNTDIGWMSSSQEIDWRNMSCDSLVNITVDTAVVNGILEEVIAAGAFNVYVFSIDTMRLALEHANHPKILADYDGMQWINEEGEVQFVGNSIQSSMDNSGEYYIELPYSFEDVNFEVGSIVNCTKTFGPYQLSFLSSTVDVPMAYQHTVIPNPNKGVFTFQLESVVRERLTLEIYNIGGQKIKTRNLEGNSNTIDISNQAKGTYIYKIIGNLGKVGFGKVVVI